MSILSYFRTRTKPSAPVAKERLQILLAHERANAAQPDYLPRLKNEILQVISKFVTIDADKISVELDNAGSVSTLEVNIELPNPGLAPQTAAS